MYSSVIKFIVSSIQNKVQFHLFLCVWIYQNIDEFVIIMQS